jgi:O-antigen/teichoic acid export membrane protein
MIHRKLFKSEFARNVLTLVTGNTVAQAIPVAISPILTRLYSPDDFGVYALFASLTGIMAVVATGRYEAAIMLPEQEEDSANLTTLSVSLTIIFSALLFFLVLVLNNPLAQLLGNTAVAPWLYIVPLSVLFLGTYQSLNYWWNRQKAYRRLASSKVYQSGVMSAGQLGLGVLKAGGGGLIAGAVAGQFAAALILLKAIWKNGRGSFSETSPEQMKAMARRYSRFPRFSIAGAFVNSLAYNLAYILISMLFSSTVLGFYALVYRVLATPSTVIGSAIAQVYFERASVEKKQSGSTRNSFRNTFKRLLQIGIPVFLILFLFARYLFTFVFGSQWADAGLYAQILLPFFLVRFISAALSTTMTVFEKLKQALYVHSSIIIGNLVVFSLAYFLKLEFQTFLYFYSGTLSILYAAFLVYYHRLSKGT